MLENLDPDLVSVFNENFSKHLTAEFDIATRLQSFFSTGILPDTCKTLKVLRCIHQEIVFPVVMKLRQSIYENFPYKDMKGSWGIYVVIMDTNEVRVIHCKKEQSHDPNPIAHFEMEWAMAITLSFPSEDDLAMLNSNNNNRHHHYHANHSSATASTHSTEQNNNTNNIHTNGNVNNEFSLQSVDFWISDYWLDDGFDKTKKPLLFKLLQKFFHPDTATMYVEIDICFIAQLLICKLGVYGVNLTYFKLMYTETSQDLPQKLLLQMLITKWWYVFLFLAPL